MRTDLGKLGEISVTNDDRYNPILADVWEKVKDLHQGVLHKTIAILILDPEDARDICVAFDIKESNKLDQDIQILNRINFFHEFLNFCRVRNNDRLSQKISTKTPGETMDNNNDPVTVNDTIINKVINYSTYKFSNYSIKIIIVIALILIALYIVRQSRKQPNRGTQSVDQPAILTPKGNAILCLVVPNNRIESELRDLLLPLSVQELTEEYAKSLLDKSVYFLACNESNLNRYVRGLNFIQDPISIPEDGDMYIELLLPEGEDTIGKDIKRSLSRRLPNNAIVQRVELLADLDNIDEFYRA